MSSRRELRTRFERLAVTFGSPLALIFTAVAIALRWLLDPWLGDTYPLATLYGAVAAAVWVGGQGPAALAAISGYLACDYLFIEPRGSFGLPNTPTFVGALVYFATSGIIIALGNAVRTARRNVHWHDELLRTTLGNIDDGVITTDMSGRITSVNPVGETLLGWRQRDARGQLLSDVFHVIAEDSRAVIENATTQVLREDEAVAFADHCVLIAKDGTERPIENRASPLRDERGHIIGCVLMFRDATEKRNAAVAVQRSEREFADFFDHTNVPLHWIGPEGVIQRANQAQLDLLGYTRDEYVGRHVSRFHVDRDVIDDVLARLFRGDSLKRYPARMRCKNGSIKKVLIDSNSLWEKDRFVHSRCFMFDVTEQRREEETRSLLAAIVAASDDAIVSKTLEGIILSWNEGAHRLFGYSPAEAVGRSGDLIIPSELRQQEREILERIRQGDRVDHFETVRVAKDGRRLNVSLTISPVRDDSGRVIGASKVARDISDRKQVEAALRDADRRKDEFLATLAHELRNPLAPIRHSLEILLRSEGDPRLFRHATDILGRQLAHMIRLVDDLLDVSRITRDKLQLRKTRVDLASIIRHAVEASRPLAERDQQTIEVVLPDQPVYLDADPVRLTQVFSNLFNNACQYTEPGGRIWLTAEQQNREVVLVVRDSGIGMPADQLDGIFEMFAQVDDDSERPRRGLGIGLTLVRRLVQLHGGTVTARSEGRGLGSEFEVRLPVLESHPEPDESQPLEAPEAGVRRVLVVDDNRDSADSIATLLQMSDHKTFIVHDGLAAVEAAERLRPEVILLDVGLPKISGIEACRRIRGQTWGKGIVIVALTGWGQENDRRSTREAGFDAHLVKPVDYQELLQLLAALLPIT
ncbi:MAG TPA: PAS domain S-box protein [Vicinamibacterales bacterium]|jgi:PAS domain S-box-containing protein|nr:PAS domain S-box protein [Vicinamibacterales bacterium]